MIGAARLLRRQEPTLIGDERYRRVHTAVESLRVRPVADRGRRNARAPSLLFQAVGLIAAPAVDQFLTVSRKHRHRMHAFDLKGLSAGRAGAQEPGVDVRSLALAGERQQRAVRRPGGTRGLGRRAGVSEGGRRSVGRRDPNLVVAPIVVFDDGRDDERDPPPVGRELRIGDNREAIVVGGLPWPGGSLLPMEGYREPSQSEHHPDSLETHTSLNYRGGQTKYGRAI